MCSRLSWAKEERERTDAQGSQVLFSCQRKFYFIIWRWRFQCKRTESILLDVRCEVIDDLRSHVLYWCWSTWFYQVQSQILWIHFPAGPFTSQHYKKDLISGLITKCHSAWLTIGHIESLWSIVKKKTRNSRPKKYRWATQISLIPQQNHRLQ